MMSCGASKLDTLLSMLGRPGRMQVICTAFLIYAFLHAVAMNFLVSFATMTPSHRCKLPDDWSWPENASFPHHRMSHQSANEEGTTWKVVHDSCHVFVDPFNHTAGVTTCPDGYEYRHRDDDDDERFTVSTEWNLVCGHKYLVRVFQVSYFMGVLVGGIIGGFMCDSFGRRPVWLLNEALYLAVGVAFHFDFGFVMCCIFIFILGTAVQSKLQAAYSLGLEMFPDSYRTMVGIATFSSPAISYAVATAIAYYVHDWRTQIFLHALLTLVAFPAYWLTPESIRWLVAHGRNQEALLACHSFARFNGVALPPSIDRDVRDVVDAIECDLAYLAKKQTIVDVLRNSKMRNYLFVVSFAQYSAQLSLYGFSFLMAEIGGNVYRNSFIVSVIDCVLRFSSYFTLEKFGRKATTIFALSTMGILHTLSFIIRLLEHGSPTLKMASMIASIGARVLNGIFFCSFLLLVVEVFPTTVRTTAQGMIGASGRAGLLSTPLLLFLSDYAWKPLPFVVFGVVGIASGCLCAFLPETKGRPLPSTIEEAIRLSRNKSVTTPIAINRLSTEPVKYFPDELMALK